MKLSSWLSPNDVKPGDLLLHLGRSQVSALVAWFGDSIYSHISIMVDDGQLIEAATGGVRSVPLSRRLSQSDRFYFIDVYRPVARAGRIPTAPDVAEVNKRAKFYLGSAYPFSLLAQLGIISAVRGRLPESNLARWIIRIALDAALTRDAKQVMCSELTYRALAEAATTPLSAMTPAILVAAPLHLPFPEIDWSALRRELEEMLKPFPQDFAREMQSAANGTEPTLNGTHSDDALLQDYAKLRTQLNGEPTNSIGPATDSILVPNPNPKTVTPADLERSPSTRWLGRLRLA